MTEIKPWSSSVARLVDVAAGRSPADMVVRNCRWVNVHSGEIVAHSDFAIVDGRFAYCGGDASHCMGDNTVLVDGEDRYMVPGLCDAHMHVESGMLTVSEFAKAVVPHGTTSMFIDPHEIANVLGLRGVKLMHDEAQQLPLNVFVQMPSCVPSAPGLEHAGGSLTVEDVAEAMNWPNIIGLGEVMNFPGVAGGDAKMLGEISATMQAHKTVGGHYASPDLGPNFHAYAAGGPADDHEGTRMEDAIARVRQGMKAMLRLGSAWYDVAEQVRAITEKGLDSRNFILCTDDCHSGTLVNEGHMNRVVRHAIAQGLKPVTAIQMATINTAQHFGLERELGSIAPGRRADFLLVSDLPALEIDAVYARGQMLAQQGRMSTTFPAFTYPDFAKSTVNMKRDIVAEDFSILAHAKATQVTANVIGVIENQAPTKALQRSLKVVDGKVQMDREQDICQIALVERHRATGSVTNGFVSGFGYDKDCAIASTVAHDSHHMIVIGTNHSNMAAAANRLREVGGGVCVFHKGKELALVELPIAGLMSEEPAQVVAHKAQGMVEAMQAMGCRLNNAYMQHSLLALVVIPELRISDIGLIDVRRFEKIDLFA